MGGAEAEDAPREKHPTSPENRRVLGDIRPGQHVDPGRERRARGPDPAPAGQGAREPPARRRDLER